MSKERPILFSAPMVRAILAGTKSQTRRVVKPQPDVDARFFSVDAAINDKGNHAGVAAWFLDTNESGLPPVFCPYGSPGDRLWVRETWAHDAESLERCRAAYEDAMAGITYGPYYRATEVAPDTLHWRPSIHMPRWASRITLEVTGVRVERLQDISTHDCWAEGIPSSPDVDPCHEYRELWESINGPGSWDANPWVWVIEFRRI